MSLKRSGTKIVGSGNFQATIEIFSDSIIHQGIAICSFCLFYLTSPIMRPPIKIIKLSLLFLKKIRYILHQPINIILQIHYRQMLDTTDKKILTILQTNGRITNTKLAQKIGLSPPAVLERVRRLESSGIIEKYVAILDRERAGFGLQTIVMVCLSHHQISSLQNVKERLTRMDEVLECHQLTGEVDFLLKVAVKDMNSYTDFVNNKLSGIPGIQNVKTSFILETLKNCTALKLISEG